MISPSTKDSKTSYDACGDTFLMQLSPSFSYPNYQGEKGVIMPSFLERRNIMATLSPQRIDFNNLTTLQQFNKTQFSPNTLQPFNNLTKSNFPQNTLQPFNSLTKSKEVGMCLGHGEPTPTITPCRMDGIWIRKQFFIVFGSHS